MKNRHKVQVPLLCVVLLFLSKASVVQAEFRINYVPISIDDITIIIPVFNPDTDGDGTPDYDDPSLLPEQVFNAFGNALVAGNIDAAVQFMFASKRERYLQAFTALGSAAGSVMKGITNTTVMSSSATMMEIGVHRMVDGELRAYIVTLMKGPDSVWRISEL